MAHYYGVVWSYSGDSLSHHGIKGQRWGIRRYQNEDGTLTDEGRRHLGYSDKEKPIVSRREYRSIRKDARAEDKEFRKEKREALKGLKGEKRIRTEGYYDELESGMAKSRAVLERNAGHTRAAEKFNKKAEKLAKSTEEYQRLKEVDAGKKMVNETFDKLETKPSGKEREKLANEMMKYIRDDPYGTVGNEAASRLHTVLADKAYDAFGDYDFNKDEYANCKTPGIRKADKAYMESKQAVKKRENELDKLARDTSTNRLDFNKLAKLEKNDAKLKELRDSEKKSGDKFAEECLKAIGFPVTPENIETIWPFLYGS